MLTKHPFAVHTAANIYTFFGVTIAPLFSCVVLSMYRGLYSTWPFYTLPRVGYDNMFSIKFESPYPALITSFVKYSGSYFYDAFIVF